MAAESTRPVPDAPVRSRFLLVSADPSLIEAVSAAARAMSAWLEIMPTVDAGLAWLLHPSPTATHVLAQASLPLSDIDSLAGMVDEVTAGAARMFLLGHGDNGAELGAGDANGYGVIQIDPCDALHIAEVLRAYPPGGRAPGPEIDGTDVRAALHGGRLRMRFQPVLHASSLEFAGVEALSRLHHPTLGILRPSQFMQQAIETAQECALSAMAPARAIMDLRGVAFMRDRTIAFNVPLTTFLHESSPADALELCAIASFPPNRVTIELVETTDRPDLRLLADALHRWRRVGFDVTIDDAGPRLPHWRELLAMPFTGLKLDGSLAKPISTAVAMAETIVAAAKKNGLQVVAEGIEDATSMRRMRAIGVDLLQGYYFCRPMPVRALRIWSEAWESLLKSGAAAE